MPESDALRRDVEELKKRLAYLEAHSAMVARYLNQSGNIGQHFRDESQRLRVLHGVTQG